MNAIMTMKMKFKKNQKGLTLIELLAVIVILGIISAIAVPAIGGIIEGSKDQADAANVIMIKEAVVLKLLSENTATTATPTGTIASLTAEGYLSKTIVFNSLTHTGYSATFTGGAWVVTMT